MNIHELKTVANYAKQQKVSIGYIYRLITEKKMKAVVIDGVKFIDAEAYKMLPTRE